MANSEPAKILNGKEIAASIRESVKQQIIKLREQHIGFTPRLVIVQVGDREDSNVYIRMKIKAAAEVGVDVEHKKLSRDTSEYQLISCIKFLNDDPRVHGILLQLPLDVTTPINSDKCTNQIAPVKDVDGLCNENIGRLASGDLQDCLIPCTPAGCLQLIQYTRVGLVGKRAVVIGRSKIVVCSELCDPFVYCVIVSRGHRCLGCYYGNMQLLQYVIPDHMISLQLLGKLTY